MALEKRGEIMPLAQDPAEELELLQKRIAQLQERIGVVEPTPEQKEQMVEKEVAAYRNEATEKVIDTSLAMSGDDVVLASEQVIEQPHSQLDELTDILVHKGVKNALNVVEKIGSPFVTDDFHRFLVQYLADGMDVQGLKEGTPLYKALHMTLFEVTLPHIDHDRKDFAHLVTAMEQFFEGMLSVKAESKMQKYFSIEIANSNEHEHIVFYVAVPNAKVGLFEKHITSVFPRAHIERVRGDYNPFNKEGSSVGSILKLTRPPVLPLKTYQQLDQDSLNVLLGAFSKLKKDGEGAAVQLIVSPVQDVINKEYKEVLSQVKKGASLNRALEGATMKVAREIMGMFSDSSKNEKDTSGDVDESLVRAIEQKIASPIVETNIRIIASAESAERASEILGELESAFHQFANEPHNSVGFRRVSSAGLKSLLHDFSFRLFVEKYAVRLNLQELTTMIHFPVTESSSADLKRSSIVSAPAPANMQPEGVLLGKNTHQGVERDVYLAPEDRMRHMYVIGQTGTGKTTLLKNMIIQDIERGEGVCYIDPHGTDIEDILNAIPEHRKDDVIYFDPSDVSRPMGLNMLEYDFARPEQKTFVINEMLSIFNKLFNMKEAGGPMFEQYFRNATALAIDDPSTGNTLLDISRVLADARYRAQKLEQCSNPIVVQFWKEIAAKAGGDASLQNIVPYITSKFDVFLSNDIMRSVVIQEKSSFNMRDVMDTKKILLVNLAKGRLGDINSHLIGLVLVGKILMAALSRVDRVGDGKPADFYLYIDEFQNVTTDSISAILSEARKYRLSLTIAHQFIAQLDSGIRDAVFGNVGSMAAFRVGTEDAEYLQSQFAPVFSSQDIMRIPNHNAYVKMLVNGYPADPFNMQTFTPHEGDVEVGKEVKDLSRQKYGKDRQEVDALIAQKYADMQKAAEEARLRMRPRMRPGASSGAQTQSAPPVQRPVASATPASAASQDNSPALKNTAPVTPPKTNSEISDATFPPQENVKTSQPEVQTESEDKKSAVAQKAPDPYREPVE